MGYGVEEPDEPTDPNFNEAIRHIEATKIHWVAQLELVLRHPVQLWLDVNALHGNYALVQPFVHQAISGTLQAISTLAFDSQWHDKIAAARVVHITLPAPGQPTRAALKDGFLTIYFKLTREPHLANYEARTAILAALGHDPNTLVERTQAEDLELAALEEALAPPRPPQAQPGPRAASNEDIYQAAEAWMRQLEQLMRTENLWPGDKPAGEIEVRGAFGSENMAFTQWLAWILIDRVRDIIRERGEFPKHSQVAVYARREFDGTPGGDAVADVLMHFDDFIERLN